jgi:hypothetical protein
MSCVDDGGQEFYFFGSNRASDGERRPLHRRRRHRVVRRGLKQLARLVGRQLRHAEYDGPPEVLREEPADDAAPLVVKAPHRPVRWLR